MGRILGVAALAAGIWLLAFFGQSRPQPLGLDAPLDHFSAARADAALGRLLADQRPRPAGSPENAAFRDRLLKELAALPNVWCKMSGLVTEADHAKWTPADLQPYIDHVIATFGFDRVMFGGDWPVSTQASDYPRWVATLDAALRGASAADLKKLYVTNAEAFYRI